MMDANEKPMKIIRVTNKKNGVTYLYEDQAFWNSEKKRGELVQMLAGMLYVKGRMGWRDYQRRTQLFGAMPKTHLIDSILDISRFDARRNRLMTRDEIESRQKDSYRLRRLLKGS